MQIALQMLREEMQTGVYFRLFENSVKWEHCFDFQEHRYSETTSFGTKLLKLKSFRKHLSFAFRAISVH